MSKRAGPGVQGAVLTGRRGALGLAALHRGGLEAGPQSHLVVAAAGRHAVLDIGHEGVDESRVVSHGLAAGGG